MEVSLYVYDLSQGMARAMSRQILGTHIDAIYHTSLVFGGIEYFFGAGVQTCRPGTTHHGRPIEVMPLGNTSLPLDVILEYLESLKEIYTAESYDLFAHNCNNFTNDFAMFLVGRGIPDKIVSLPRTVLDTPFGQMLKPQIDQMMRPVTQAPLPQQQFNASQTAGQRGSHPHESLSLPLFKAAGTRPVVFKKLPPLDKLRARLDGFGDPAMIRSSIKFIRTLYEQGAVEAPLPDLSALAKSLQAATAEVETDQLFAVYDLFRVMLTDIRVSGFFAEEKEAATAIALLQHVAALKTCPYSLRLVTLHLACNFFSSPLFARTALKLEKVAGPLSSLINDGLLDADHDNVRVSASSLALNVALSERNMRVAGKADQLTIDSQTELAASLVESLSKEQKSAEAIRGTALALANLVYLTPAASDLRETLKTLNVSDAVAGSIKYSGAGDRPLLQELSTNLFAKI